MPRLSFGFRLILAYFVLIAVVAWFIVSKSVDVLGASVRQAAEEVMIDSANYVAQMIEQDLTDESINTDQLSVLMDGFLDRTLKARIYSIDKTKANLNVYITDAKGILIYDSAGAKIGEDYSQWRDVWLTLKGEYGARSTDMQAEGEPKDSVMYVAAPINWQGNILGVVSVSKHVNQFDGFVASANKSIQSYSIALLVATLAFGALITWWLSRSIQKLVVYADGLGAGEKINPPKLHERELQSLAAAMSDMQLELQDKQYVENYLHTLAHELKSPLTGIKGAVELLQEKMPAERKKQFVNNIGDSAERMLLLVERLLQLAQVEKRQGLENVQHFQPAEMVERLRQERVERLSSQNIVLVNKIPSDLVIKGEALLIEQALANLIDNAIDFSPEKSEINIHAGTQSGQYVISVADAGKGIPDHMQDKVFERFISTQRPNTRKRSTGLGLSFVKEVMVLHRGSVELANTNPGLRVRLQW